MLRSHGAGRDFTCSPTRSAIPKNYICQGKDISPALKWSGRRTDPEPRAHRRRSRCADPAAPKRVWVHWVLYNILSMRMAGGSGECDHAAGRNARG